MIRLALPALFGQPLALLVATVHLSVLQVSLQVEYLIPTSILMITSLTAFAGVAPYILV